MVYKSFEDQRGVAPIVFLLSAAVILGLGVIWVSQQSLSETNQTTPPVLDEPTNLSESPTPTPTPTKITPTPSVSQKSKPTSTPAPTSTPTPQPEITASFTKDGPQYRIFTSWKNITNSTGGDWVGVFKYGDLSDTPVGNDRIYSISCAKKDQTFDMSKPGLVSGSCPMYLNLSDGTYELRLYRNDTTTRLATGGQFNIP